MNVLAAGQAEFHVVVAVQKTIAALKRYIPRTADRLYKMDEKVLVNSEKNEWTSSLMFVFVTGKMGTIKTLDE